MLRQWTAALLAATAFFPLTALAQDADRDARVRAPRAERADQAPRPRGDMGQRGGWQRPERPAGQPQGWAGQNARGGWQRSVSSGDQPRPDRNPGNWQRPDRGTPNGGNWQQRPGRNPDLPNGWAQRPPRDGGQGNGWQQRPDRQPGQTDWRGRRDNDADWVRRQRDWAQRSGQGRSWSDWNDHYRDRDGFRDRRDWAQGRGWYGDRNGWNGNDWNNRGWDRGRGGGWNRDWRHDRRYDWNAYRTSNRNLYRLPRYYAPYGWNYGYRRFGIGVTLDSLLFAQSYWIDDPWEYRLPPADGPYRWVRYYNDALLVDVDSGEVVDVIYGIFW